MSSEIKANAAAAEQMKNDVAQPVVPLKDDELATLNGGSFFDSFMDVVHDVTDPIGAGAQAAYHAAGGHNRYVKAALGAAGEVAEHS